MTVGPAQMDLEGMGASFFKKKLYLPSCSWILCFPIHFCRRKKCHYGCWALVPGELKTFHGALVPFLWSLLSCNYFSSDMGQAPQLTIAPLESRFAQSYWQCTWHIPQHLPSYNGLPKKNTFSRICVKMDFNKWILAEIHLVSEGYKWVQRLDFENAIFHYKVCFEISHFSKSCPKAYKLHRRRHKGTWWDGANFEHYTIFKSNSTTKDAKNNAKTQEDQQNKATSPLSIEEEEAQDQVSEPLGHTDPTTSRNQGLNKSMTQTTPANEVESKSAPIKKDTPTEIGCTKVIKKRSKNTPTSPRKTRSQTSQNLKAIGSSKNIKKPNWLISKGWIGTAITLKETVRVGQV